MDFSDVERAYTSVLYENNGDGTATISAHVHIGDYYDDKTYVVTIAAIEEYLTLSLSMASIADPALLDKASKIMESFTAIPDTAEGADPHG